MQGKFLEIQYFLYLKLGGQTHKKGERMRYIITLIVMIFVSNLFSQLILLLSEEGAGEEDLDVEISVVGCITWKQLKKSVELLLA